MGLELAGVALLKKIGIDIGEKYLPALEGFLGGTAGEIAGAAAPIPSEAIESVGMDIIPQIRTGLSQFLGNRANQIAIATQFEPYIEDALVGSRKNVKVPFTNYEIPITQGQAALLGVSAFPQFAGRGGLSAQAAISSGRYFAGQLGGAFYRPSDRAVQSTFNKTGIWVGEPSTTAKINRQFGSILLPAVTTGENMSSLISNAVDTGVKDIKTTFNRLEDSIRSEYNTTVNEIEKHFAGGTQSDKVEALKTQIRYIQNGYTAIPGNSQAAEIEINRLYSQIADIEERGRQKAAALAYAENKKNQALQAVAAAPSPMPPDITVVNGMPGVSGNFPNLLPILMGFLHRGKKNKKKNKKR